MDEDEDEDMDEDDDDEPAGLFESDDDDDNEEAGDDSDEELSDPDDEPPKKGAKKGAKAISNKEFQRKLKSTSSTYTICASPIQFDISSLIQHIHFAKLPIR